MKVRLLTAAVPDLREALAFISIDNPSAAVQVGLRLEKAIAMIGERPSIGRATDRQSVREWSVPGLPYVVPYRVSDGTVEIIRIWHTSRQRPNEW